MKKKVLVVDDERGIVKLLSMRLRAKGYEVFEAYDGSECINIAIKELPQLILLDIKMPLGGIDAFQEMLKIDKTRNIPVIFMTAYHTPDINTQVLEMGAKACMSKPFFGNEIINNIAMYI